MLSQFGRWVSPITAERLAEKAAVLSQFLVAGANNDVYLSQLLPKEKGRYSVFKLLQSENSVTARNLLPNDAYNARTRVHEYGGQCTAVDARKNLLYFVNFADQNLYQVSTAETAAAAEEAPKQITSGGIRFAELTCTQHGIVAVGEEHDHTSSELVSNFLVLIHPETGRVQRLDLGMEADFFAYPTVWENDCGMVKLAWITWNHPNMPWNNTELWTCNLLADGVCTHVTRLAANASFQQPRWNEKTGEELVYLSDESGFWNFYSLLVNKAGDGPQCLLARETEFGDALWSLGMRTWDFLPNGDIVAQMKQGGMASLVKISRSSNNALTKLDQLPYCAFANVTALRGTGKEEVVFLASSPTSSTALIKLNLETGAHSTLFASKNGDDDEETEFADYISCAEHITFPTTTTDGSSIKEAHAFFYQPRNVKHTSAVVGEEQGLPPLLIFLHGGPTSACNNALSLPIQFWTSRGFAVANVNYRGSTGYGREFRQALERATEEDAGNWGITDVEDCVSCVEYLVARNKVDGQRVAIRGGSAGGFTTLACLANSQVFKAGTSYYGVSDLLALAKDTHKFESRYLDRLIGDLPRFEQEYVRRSPISNLDRFTAPLLVLQGSEDKIVPPNQSERIVDALRAKNILVEYKLYAGEQHGFRKAETLVDSLNRELAFYQKVFYPPLRATSKDTGEV